MSETSKNGAGLGFKKPSTITEEQYKAPFTADNMAPAELPRLLLVMKNLGFPAPVVTIGNSDPNQYALQLGDYLSRGADPAVPVAVNLHWTEPDGSVQRVAVAAVIYNAFANGLWQGFGKTAAVVFPGKPFIEYRELAFEQMPTLGEWFTVALDEVASKGVKELA